MNCGDVREVLSAQLDGEQPGVPSGFADQHRAECAACARWYASVARLDRLLRIAPAPESVGTGAAEPVEGLLDTVRLPPRTRLRQGARVALLVVGVVQLAVGALNAFGLLGMHMGEQAGTHMSHELGAFNIAFGIALLVVGLDTRRAATHLPVLGGFLVVLVAASVFDLFGGAVGWVRLVTHAPILLGSVLAGALAYTHRPDAGPSPSEATRGNHATERSDRAGDDLDDPRGEARPGSPPPAAYRKSA